MLNKENSSYSTGTKEKEERKQFSKPGDKGENKQFKPANKTESKTGAKPHGKECLEMNEEEECESSPRKGKSGDT